MLKIARYKTTVKSVVEKKRKVHVSGSGPEWIHEEESAGWFIITDEDIGFFIGMEKPKNVSIGDTIILTLAKVEDNAKPE